MKRHVALLILALIPVPSLANVVGVDTQNFNPTSNGVDFVTVQSSETLGPGIINFGLFFNHAVNTLPYYKTEDGDRSKSKAYRDSLTGADISAGIGLTRNWDLGISLPQIIRQHVKDDSNRSEFDTKGNSEIRFNTKLRLWGKQSYGVAAIGTIGLNRIQDNPYVGKDAGPTTTLELAADFSVNRVAFGFNVGHRWRQAGEALEEYPIEPMKNQFIASSAASYHIKSISSKLIAEIFGSWPVKNVHADINRHMFSMEALLGLKHDLTANVALHVGGGTELMNGVSSPDWRAYAGTNITMGPVWGGKPVRKVVRAAPKPRPKTKPAPVPEPELPIEEPPIMLDDSVDLMASNPQANTVETIVISSVFFVFDSDTQVLKGAIKELEKVAEYVKMPPTFKKMIVEGHTDYMGSDEYNMKLSQERADSVRKYLVLKLGIPADKIQAIGYGESRPISDNGNYQGRQDNRRVEFKIFR